MNNDPHAESISHQFRTPLNAIIGFTGTLLMQLPGPINQDQEKQLRIIQTSAKALLSMIDGAPQENRQALDAQSLLPDTHDDDFTSRRTIAPSRILLIEDDALSRKLLVYLLKSMGHEPLVAENGERGLTMAREEVPDLILCDVELPGINGNQVAQALKRDPMLHRIPIVAVTANSPTPLHEKSATDAFDYHLHKPIRAETLAAKLQIFIAGGAIPRDPPAIMSSIKDVCRSEKAMT